MFRASKTPRPQDPKTQRIQDSKPPTLRLTPQDSKASRLQSTITLQRLNENRSAYPRGIPCVVAAPNSRNKYRSWFSSSSSSSNSSNGSTLSMAHMCCIDSVLKMCEGCSHKQHSSPHIYIYTSIYLHHAHIAYASHTHFICLLPTYLFACTYDIFLNAMQLWWTSCMCIHVVVFGSLLMTAIGCQPGHSMMR